MAAKRKMVKAPKFPEQVYGSKIDDYTVLWTEDELPESGLEDGDIVARYQFAGLSRYRPQSFRLEDM